MRRPRPSLLVLVLTGIWLGACQALLGIEPLSGAAEDAGSGGRDAGDGGEDASHDAAEDSSVEAATDAPSESPDDVMLDASAEERPPRTVHGRVVGRYLEPLPLVTVMGPSGATTTDADGRFSTLVSSTEYDLVVVTASRLVAYRFEGLARDDPTLQLGDAVLPHERLLNGRFTGSAVPLPANRQILLVFDGPTGASSRFVLPENQGSFAAHSHRWAGEPDTEILARAFLLEVQGDRTVAFLGAAEFLRPLAPGSVPFQLGDLPLELQSVPTRAVRGSVQGPVPGDLQVRLSAAFGATASGEISRFPAVEGTFTAEVPDLPGLELWISLVSTADGEVRMAHARAPLDDTVVPLTLPPRVTVESPGAVAEWTEDLELRWRAPAGAVCEVVLRTSVENGLRVVTTRGAARLPNVDLPGLRLPPERDGYWSVECHFGPGSMDEATGPGGFRELDSSPYRQAQLRRRSAPGAYAESTFRTLLAP